MRDDDPGVGDESLERGRVDLAARDHVVGDAGQPCHLGRDRAGGLIESLKDAADAADRVALVVSEFDRGDFDHLILRDVETGGLEIDDDADPFGQSRGSARFARHETAQHLVVAGRFEVARHVVEVRRASVML